MNTNADEMEFEEEEEGQEQELQAETQESLESEAKLMGWVPEAQFKGPKDHWISAEEFVDKGRHVMPILLANNKRLQKELLTRDAKLDTLATKLTTAQKTLGKLEGHYAEATTRAVAAAKKDLMAQLQLAREDNDVEAEEAIRDQLDVLKATPAVKPEADEPASTPALSSDFVSWQEDNPWFNEDKKRTKAVLRIAEDLRDEGVTSQGRKFMDECTARLLEQEGDPGEVVRPASKVETGSNRGSNSSRGTGRSFADLPSDAKQACWNDIDDLVGPDKTFKTKSEWEKEYTRIYYGMTQ